VTPVQKRIKPDHGGIESKCSSLGRVVDVCGGSLVEPSFEFVLTRKLKFQLRDACPKESQARSHVVEEGCGTFDRRPFEFVLTCKLNAQLQDACSSGLEPNPGQIVVGEWRYEWKERGRET
jgi:hypothetical protein